MGTARFFYMGFNKPGYLQNTFMQSREIVRKVEEVIRPILEVDRFEIVDIEFKLERGRWVLRIYVDKPGGVTVDDCADVSHEVEDIIEVKELVPFGYVLEVSSPGLDRPLKREHDFERFSGRVARIRTIEPIQGRRNFVGTIVGCKQGIVEIIDEEGRIQRLPLDNMHNARLKVELQL